MEIANETAHRALGYVAATTRSGHRLNEQQFNAYANQPGRTITSTGGLMSLLEASTSVMRSLGPQASVEPILDWLVRLMWLDRNGPYVKITRLGEAVLASLEERAAEPEGPVVTILESKDALAYPTVIGNIGKRGDALLIDPYFKLDALPHVLQFTDVARLMIGPNADVSSIGAALSTTITPNRPFEIRVSNESHDRFVIPISGPVDAIGTSLSGVGRRYSVMFEISLPEADGIRQTCNEMWERAEPLVAASGPTSSATTPTAAKKTPRRRKPTRPKLLESRDE